MFHREVLFPKRIMSECFRGCYTCIIYMYRNKGFLLQTSTHPINTHCDR